MTCWRPMVFLLALPLCALAQRPPAVVPVRSDTVIGTLPKGYAELVPRAAASRPTVAVAERMLATAARTGDARLVARADAILARIPNARPDPALLGARAYAAQYRHDFDAALAWLDEAIRLDPRDPDMRLARAQILLVQGELMRARSECAALAFGVDAERGLICVAAVALREGRYEKAGRLLERWLQRAGGDREARRNVLVMRAEAASRQSAPDADAWFERALASVPGDVRTLAALSRHLRAHGRASEALARLADAPDNDHLLLERALVAQAARSPDAARLADRIARRFSDMRSLGDEPDARDEAQYLLLLRGSPAAALTLAKRNFAEQRDHEDVELLRRSAIAARQPQAWRAVEAWARSQRLPLASTGEATR